MNEYSLDDFGDIQAVLYTHRHPDHLDDSQAGSLLGRGTRLYGNADVCALLGPEVIELRNGETIDIAGFEVTPRDLPHVPMVNGSPGPPNTGFTIDDRLFHPGDSMEPAGFEVDLLALPIAGPSISFRDAYAFAEQVGADKVVPIHYDYFIADPHLFAKYCDVAEVIILRLGESAYL